jgi:hypothetical protein
VGALTQLATVRRWPIFAFSLGLAYQPIWVAYAFAAHGYGFLVATAGFVAVNAWNLGKVLAARRAERASLFFGDAFYGKTYVIHDGHIEEET